MRRILIVTGFIIGVLIVLFEASLSYADTATISDELGLDIPNKVTFILRLLILGTIGAFLGLGTHKIFILFKAFCKKRKNNKY